MTTSAQFTSNLKKWFWGFLLGQLVISSAAFFFFTGSVQSTVNTHSAEIDYLKLQMAAKADKEMVMRIKADNDKLVETGDCHPANGTEISIGNCGHQAGCEVDSHNRIMLPVTDGGIDDIIISGVGGECAGKTPSEVDIPRLISLRYACE